MKLSSAPQHEAILSNVGEVGEFRIRNSAKAFSILSSGLYSNKIRAIIRELSCNAVDSHVAANRNTTPFDVHLPNAMEPWFAIRDYGVGLSYDQVVNIYTTYFESTKTDSNAYIGALGLGSKSPFSYTDNFTVTAIQNGTKGIYSAFINGEGVPSIAKMMEESTKEPNGVEVKFSVNERYDYSKFKEEAAHVYSHFKLQPVVSGSSDFKIREIEFKTRDIIPGVHETNTRNSYSNSSMAIMGNIAYPIEVPNASTVLGDLASLLQCGLHIEFEIGELDFQASREGLSYIPQTINSIKRKLQQISDQLTVYVVTEADKIDNLWERSTFLMDKSRSKLWIKSVIDYIKTTKFPLIQAQNWGLQETVFKLSMEKLAKDYNIKLKSYRKDVHRTVQMVEQNPSSVYIKDVNDSTRIVRTEYEHNVSTDNQTTFVIGDVKVGPIERTKYHYRTVKSKPDEVSVRNVYLLLPEDKTKEMKTKEFFKKIYNPKNIVQVSNLLEKPRKLNVRGGNVTIMKLQRKDAGLTYYKRNDGGTLVWRDAGKSNDFDKSKTYYYFQLRGFEMVPTLEHHFSAQEIAELLKSSKLLQFHHIDVYGVRKHDLEFIKSQPNWVNLESHIQSVLTNLDQSTITSLVKSKLDEYEFLKYNSTIISNITNTNSKYKTLVTQYKDVQKIEYTHSLIRLLKRFTPEVEVKIHKIANDLESECKKVYNNYPILNLISTYGDNYNKHKEIAEYINLVDNQT